MHWFSANVGAISVFVSIATLMVWVFYAHLLWKGFRRAERPFIVIHQAGGMGSASSCLVANLSRHPMHILQVHFVLRTENHEFGLRLNEYTRVTTSDQRDWASENILKEGPLKSGEFLSLGNFASMVESARVDYDGDGDEDSERNRELAEKTQEFEIRVIAMFSSFGRPIGAIRPFMVSTEGKVVHLIPKAPVTEQLTSHRQRRRVYQWLVESQKRERE